MKHSNNIAFQCDPSMEVQLDALEIVQKSSRESSLEKHSLCNLWLIQVNLIIKFSFHIDRYSAFTFDSWNSNAVETWVHMVPAMPHSFL